MSTALKWSAGKFVHLRGVDTPLHFMPLHDFHLEYGLDLSLLMALRAARSQGGSTTLSDLPLAQWLHRTAAVEIANLAIRLMGDLSDPATVVEVGPGVGLTFECLKGMLHRLPVEKRSGQARYLAMGPHNFSFGFSQLHPENEIPYEYIDWTAPERVTGTPESALLIVNHWQSTSGDAALENLSGWLKAHRGPIVVAARAVNDSLGAWKTTVRRKEIYLPSLAEVLNQLAEGGRVPQYRFAEGFDANYVLPDDGPSGGLLLAIGTRPPQEIKGFKNWQPKPS